jgi:chromosome segregation ATPase
MLSTFAYIHGDVRRYRVRRLARPRGVSTLIAIDNSEGHMNAYRDDLEAAHLRAADLEREVAALRARNEALTAKLAAGDTAEKRENARRLAIAIAREQREQSQRELAEIDACNARARARADAAARAKAGAAARGKLDAERAELRRLAAERAQGLQAVRQNLAMILGVTGAIIVVGAFIAQAIGVLIAALVIFGALGSALGSHK